MAVIAAFLAGVTVTAVFFYALVRTTRRER